MKKFGLLILGFALLIPSVAQAHLTGGASFMSGVLHPLSGIDHLLAMVAAGIVSVKHGGRIIWLMPAVFVASMIGGGVAGMGGIVLPFVESGIALSVVLLGMAIAFHKSLPLAATALLITFSGLLHGHAHGAEMPLTVSAMNSITGLVLMTAALHIAGVLIGQAAKKTNVTTKLLRYAGAGVGVTGVVLLLSACGPTGTQATPPPPSTTPPPAPTAPPPPPSDPYQSWKSLTIGNVIAIKIPPTCNGSGATGSSYITCPTVENPTPTPEMQISSDGEHVSFRSWEGAEWEYWDRVIASIRFITPLAHPLTVTIEQ